MNQISFKFIGDSNLCAKYLPFAKNKANTLADENKTKDSLVKNFKLSDYNYNGKYCDVFITITMNLPFIFIVIKTELKNTGTITNYLSSGLSINELNKNNIFSQFYPKETNQGFIDYSKLYRSTQINSPYGFYKTFNGDNVNQNHYLYGSQFSGKLSEYIQYLNGTTNIDIQYRFDWLQTNTIYLDSNKNEWLLTIGSNGLFARQISETTQLDNTVSVSNGVVQQPISVSVIDGIGYETNDEKLLDLSGFYNGFPLSITQGWNCNKKGDILYNITYENIDGDPCYIKGYLFKITISEIKTNGIISLKAVQEVIETGTCYLHDYLSISFPKLSDFNENYPEKIITHNYIQTKKSPLQKFFVNNNDVLGFLRTVKIQDIPNGEYKLPIQVYFDNEDNLQKIYYYLKKEDIENEIISNSGITEPSQIYQTNYFTINDLKIISQSEGYNFYSKKIKHGIIINDDETRLIIDKTGDFCKYYEFKLDNGTNFDDFVYQVKNNLLPVDLRPYENYYPSNLDQINTYINTFINEYNVFYNNFKGVIPSFIQNFNNNSNGVHYYEKYETFDIKTQLENINKLLDENNCDNTYYRIKTVIEIKDITKLNKIKVYYNLVDYQPLLYKINNNILSVFQNLTNTLIDNTKTVLDYINNKLHNNINNNLTWYSTNVLKKFNNNFTFLKNITDIKTYNKVQLNTLINDLNTQIDNINVIHNQINTIIDDINNHISSTNSFFNYVNIYSKAIEDYFNISNKDYLGIDLNHVINITTYNDYTNRTTDEYYLSNKYYNGIYKKYTQIENKKLTNIAIIFNYSCRNSLTIFKQENIFTDLIIDGKISKEVTNSNEYALYKQTKTYLNNIEQTSTDYILQDTFLNYKSYSKTDYQGNVIKFNVGLSILNDGTTTIKYNSIPNNYDYIDLINQSFSNISKTYLNYHYSNYKFNRYSNYKFNHYLYNTSTLINSSIKIIDKYFNEDDLTLTTNIKNDYRLIRNYGDENGYIENKGDGIIYFNYVRDVFTYNYVVNKDFYKYKDNILTLTNISNYNIINSNYFTNFIGKPF